MIAIIAMMLSSCSSGDLLDKIPDDIDYVMTVNLERLLSNTGFTLTDNNIEGPEALKTEINNIPENLRHEILLINQAIELKRIVTAGYLTDKGADNFCIARVKDHDDLINILEKELRAIPRTADGYDFYCGSSSTFFYLDGKRVFILNPQKGSLSDASKLLKKILEQSDKKSIMKQKHVGDLLTANRIINVAVNTTTLADLVSTYGYKYFDTKTAVMLSAALPYLKGNWLAIWGDVEKTTLTAGAFMFNQESGERIKIPGMQNIDAETLKLLPANTILACAFAINNATLAQQLQVFEPMIGDPIMKSAVKQLAKLDGTVAIGYGLNDRNELADLLTGDTFVGNLALVATFQAGAAGTAVNQLKSVMKLFGENITDEPDGFSISSNTMPKFHCTAMGNNLVITTEPTIKPTDNAIAGLVNKANSAIVFNLPSLSKYLGTDEKAGLEAELLSSDDQLSLKIEFTHPEADLATTIMKLMPALNQLAVEYRKPDAGYLPDDHAYAFDSDDPR